MLERALQLAATRAAEIEAIYDAAPVGIVLLDSDFRFVRINQRMAQTNGLAAADHIGRCIEEVLPAETCAVLRAMTPRLLAGEEVVAEISGADRATGETRSWKLSYRALRHGDGSDPCFLGTVDDITALKHAEAQLRRSNETYLGLIENNPFGVYLIDADFRVARISHGAAAAFAGVHPVIGRDFAEVIAKIWAQPFAAHVVERFRHTLATGEPHAESSTSARGDADATESYDWRIERITLPDGKFGVVCYFYDLTERRAFEDRIGLLLREVDHRARNLLTVVAAVARHTVATSPGDFLDRFEQRIQALAASQDLLVGSKWTNIPVETLARAHLAHLDDLVGHRIRVSGPSIRVNPAAAQALGMAFHELATNAAKHGALSNGDGRVALTWAVAGDDFRIDWVEKGGPPVMAPSRRGFGSTVIGAMVRASLGARVDVDYARDGFAWRVECAATRLTAETPVFAGA